MSRRRMVWLGIALCTILLALGVTDRLLRPPPDGTLPPLEEIRVGMRLQEVKAILAGPHIAFIPITKGPKGVPWEAMGRWDGGAVRIRFNRDDVVEEVAYMCIELRSRPSLLHRLRTWLGW
jgi:hypothetical protein